ncbi:MAG: OmpA family protein [Myxococcales bacterium]|nr:OmpA family protein [Myxococcales bacterium]
MRRTSLVLVSVLLTCACGPGAKAPTPPGPPGGDQPPAGERQPATEFTMTDRGSLALPGLIVFATGSAELELAASEPALWHIHDYLVAKDAVTLVRIEGHGDQSGDDALMLSGDRALSVGRWLVAHDIACERLLAAAFGDTKPIADPATAEGRAANRRIEIVNASLRGIAIGGMPLDGSAPAAAPVCD